MTGDPSNPIRPWRSGDQARCEAILRSIPEWFGLEEPLLMYARGTAELPTWLWWEGAEPIGFVTVKQHIPNGGAVDIFCIAVRKGHHRGGVGRALIDRAATWARERGSTMLFVKTMGPSKPNREYAETLKFYLALGFVPLEEFMKEWDGMPCLVLAKTLGDER